MLKSTGSSLPRQLARSSRQIPHLYVITNSELPPVLIPSDEGATSINIYLSSLGQNASDKRLFTMPNTSILVKAIRTGPALPEENILLSLSASDLQQSEETVTNAAVPHPWRARQLRHGMARLHGDVHAFSPHPLDDGVSAIGGGAVILKLVDLSQTPEELLSALTILRDMIKDSWRASEEMERIRTSSIVGWRA